MVPDNVGKLYLSQFTEMNIVLAGFAIAIACTLLTIQTKMNAVFTKKGEEDDENNCDCREEKNQEEELDKTDKSSEKYINIISLLFIISALLMLINHFTGITILTKFQELLRDDNLGYIDNICIRRIALGMYISTITSYVLFFVGLGLSGKIKSNKLFQKTLLSSGILLAIGISVNIAIHLIQE